MKILVAALALSLVSGTAMGQAPEGVYDEAVQARLAGDNARAVELLERVVAAEPQNADAQLNLGLALLGLNQLDRAEAALRRTLAIAPDYADARIGLARLEQRRGNTAAALSQLDPIGPANMEAAELRSRLTAQGRAESVRWRLDLDGSYAFLDRGRPNWQEGSVRLTHQASPATAVSAAIEAARRFRRNDTYGEVRADHRFPGNAGSVHAFIGATPDSDFLPEWQIGGGGEVRLRGGPAATILTLNARHARYRVGDIQTLNPGIDQYLANGRAWIGLRWINIFDQNGRRRSGWLGRGDLLATERLRLFAGLADAPDTSEGIVTDTSSLFGGFSYDVSDRTTVRASIAHEDRETGADRLQFGLGAGWKF